MGYGGDCLPVFKHMHLHWNFRYCSVIFYFLSNISVNRSRLWPQGSRTIALSNHVYQVVWPPFKDLALDENKFNNYYDRMEYLWSLATYGSPNRQKGNFHTGRYFSHRGHTIQEVNDAITQESNTWLLLRKGLFDGQQSLLSEAVEKHRQEMSRGRFYWIEIFLCKNPTFEEAATSHDSSEKHPPFF